MVSRLLRENAILPTVVDLNLDTVHEIRDGGGSAIYGDARYPDTLITAGIRHAGTLILSGSDAAAPEVIRVARSLNPAVRTLVRSEHLRDVPGLSQAGAERVFTGEGEVALAMTEAVLRDLGATPSRSSASGPARARNCSAPRTLPALRTRRRRARTPGQRDGAPAAVSAWTTVPTSSVRDTSSTVVPACTTAEPRAASTPPSA